MGNDDIKLILLREKRKKARLKPALPPSAGCEKKKNRLSLSPVVRKRSSMAFSRFFSRREQKNQAPGKRRAWYRGLSDISLSSLSFLLSKTTIFRAPIFIFRSIKLSFVVICRLKIYQSKCSLVLVGVTIPYHAIWKK